MFHYFSNIFATSYIYYSNPKLKVYPRFCAAMIVLLIQMCLSFLLLILLSRVITINFHLLLGNRIYLLIVLFMGGVLNVWYYNKNRTKELVQKFTAKSLTQKKMWCAITIISMVGLVLSIAILLSK